MARLRAIVTTSEGPADLEDRFPGRWDARRAIQDDLRPLVEAVARATCEAGWWTPGSGELVDGGLVCAVDLHGCEPEVAFGRSLLEPGATLRPSLFLQSLPSTPAATLGLLFGLREYQATLNILDLPGPYALGHAIDLLALGRLRRVVVAALTVVGPAGRERLHEPPQPGTYRLATAVCLEQGEGFQAPARRGLDVAELLPDIHPGYRVLAAPSLSAAARAGG